MRNTIRIAIGIFLLGCSSQEPSAHVGDGSEDAGADAALRDDAPAEGASQKGECEIGAVCGHDCSPSNAWCWACGTLHYDRACRCVASSCNTSLPGCESAQPAGEGEYCGVEYWCRRPCARGLACVPIGDTLPDGGVFRNYITHCVRETDAGAP